MVEVGRQLRGRARPEAYVGSEHTEQLGLLLLALGVLVHRGHGGAEVREVVGGREAGHAEPGDDGPHALPGVQPAQGVEVATRTHVPATHSA